MSGFFGNYRDDDECFKKYEATVQKIDGIIHDQNGWEGGIFLASGVTVPDGELELLHSLLITYKESEILKPMRAQSGNFVFNIILCRPSKPDGWSDLYQQIQRL